MNIGDKINYLRKKNNMSQEELSEKLHVSRQTISRWENNSSQPDIDSLLAISNLFSVSTDYILGKKEEIILKDRNNISPIAFGVIIVGLIFSIFSWYEYKNLLLLTVGAFTQIIGVIYFEVKNSSKKEKYIFYSKATWILSVLPLAVINNYILISIELLSSKLFGTSQGISIPLIYLSYLIIYLITNGIIIKILSSKK